MDYYTILAQQAHLARELTGQPIEQLVRSGPYTLFFSFGNGFALKLSATPDMPYLVPVDPRFIPRKNARTWHQNRFESRVLTDIAITHGDRVLTFTVEGGTQLVFELTGRHANIIIVDSDGIITGALRQVTGTASGVRSIGPGITYQSPPRREFPDLVWGVLPELSRRFEVAGGTVAGALRQSLACGSRYFATEVCARADILPDLSLEETDPTDRIRLFKTASRLALEIEQGGHGGCIIYRDDGLPHDVFPVPVAVSGLSVATFESLDEAIRTYARDREIELERRSLRSGIMSSLAAEERRIRGTMEKIKRERGSSDESDTLERHANTILAGLHRIRRGQSSVVLPDIYGEGEITIDLDPALDGAGNADRLFRRARKQRAAAELAAGRLADLARRLDGIEHDRAEADTTADIRTLRALATAHVRIRQNRQKASDDEELFPRRFTSPSGLAIIVGRNDRENDELVRWARKGDLWLHAQYIGGSHVILRAPGKQSPDRKSIERAAAIAAYYSKAKTAGIVPVVCTQVRYVTKRKGQGPGKVTYTREEVLFVEPGIPR